MSILKVMDKSGDTKLLWNANHPKEVEKAREAFNKAMKNGHEAWAINRSGGKDKKLSEFDPLAEEIICMPIPVPGPDAGSENELGTEYAD